MRHGCGTAVLRGRALPMPPKPDLLFRIATDIAGTMPTSRHLAAALAIGGALLFARPAAADDADRTLLATFCDAADIAGSACRKAKGYPDAGTRACDVKLTKERHRGKFIADHPLLVIGYESGCEPHATDGGGSVVFELVADKHVFRSFQPGTQVNDCVTLPEDTTQDILVCITGHMGQGYLESGVAQVTFKGGAGKDIETSFDFLLNATDSIGAHGANTVTCKEGPKYFGVSKLAAGPRPMTVTVEVEYADAATIRAACGKKFPRPKETFGKLSKGEAYVPDGYAKKGKFIVDFATRKVAPQG
jgi:hypothetical protein